MNRNVFMASFAFFIPLGRVKRKYIHIPTSNLCEKNPFALYPNARCSYRILERKDYSLHIGPQTFYFNSRYNGIKESWRQVEVKPFLIEFEPKTGGRLRFLALLISLDKFFCRIKGIGSLDLCTEFDLVNLKKAFFETGENSLFIEKDVKSPNHFNWLKNLLFELDGIKRTHVTIPYSLVDVKVQKMNLISNEIEVNKLDCDFTDVFNSSTPSFIDDFLSQRIDLQGIESQPATLDGQMIDERSFVYGLLYANDNFMMLHKRTMETVIDDYYTNNLVEKFWADDGNIVHVITHSPYFHPANTKNQRLAGNLTDLEGHLLDMNMLIYLKRKLANIKCKYVQWSSKRIEWALEEIANCLHERLYNHTELDRRMDYFKRKFRLLEAFESFSRLAIPRKNLIETIFNHKTTIWILIVGILTLLASIAGIFS